MVLSVDILRKCEGNKVRRKGLNATEISEANLNEVVPVNLKEMT